MIIGHYFSFLLCELECLFAFMLSSHRHNEMPCDSSQGCPPWSQPPGLTEGRWEGTVSNYQLPARVGMGGEALLLLFNFYIQNKAKGAKPMPVNSKI